MLPVQVLSIGQPGPAQTEALKRFPPGFEIGRLECSATKLKVDFDGTFQAANLETLKKSFYTTLYICLSLQRKELPNAANKSCSLFFEQEERKQRRRPTDPTKKSLGSVGRLWGSSLVERCVDVVCMGRQRASERKAPFRRE